MLGFNFLDVLLQLCIIGVVLQSLFIGVKSLVMLVEIVQGSSLPLVTPGPIGLNPESKHILLDASLSVFECLGVLMIIDV